MSLFENYKKGNSRIVKIFGKVIYIVTAGYKRRTQRYLGNIISTVKIEKDDVETKTVKVLNRVISKRTFTEDYKKDYIGNTLVKNTDLTAAIKKKYSKYIKGYTDIIILNANSGEIYLFLTYVLKSFLQKNNCEKVLLIARKKYHVNLIRLLHPEIQYVYLKKFPVFKNLTKNIGNQRFFTIFTGKHFIQVEDDIKNNPLDTSHYFYSILDDLNINKNELDFKTVVIPSDIQESMLKKISKTKLNLKNFVFLAPEAASCKEYDNEFWVDLTNEFHKKGIDVFMNIVDKDTDIVGCEYKSCKLTFSEAYALAKISKGVVSLRSGLTESLLQTEVPLFSLYTKFRNRYIFNDMEVDYVLSDFGLSKLPNINSDLLHEYNMSEISNNKVISQIVDTIKNKKE